MRPEDRTMCARLGFPPRLLLLGLALAGCSDTTAPQQRQSDNLVILRLDPTGPPLYNREVSFYAKVGEGTEGSLYFRGPQGQRTDEFARLRIGSGSLLARPDGTPFGANDSILITMRLADSSWILVELQPSGLTFRSDQPAELRLKYAHADRDFNRDGEVDDRDTEVEHRLSLWRQEKPGDPFIKVGSVRSESEKLIRANLMGFTRFAIAY